MSPSLQAIVLAAGRGTRMGTEDPKVLHQIFDRPLIDFPLQILQELGVIQPVVVLGWGKEKVSDYLGNRAKIVVQSPQLGTGHAVLATKNKIRNFQGDILVWPADMTLIEKATIEKLIRLHRKSGASASILSGFMPDPQGYGRIVRHRGKVTEIREELDASPQERKINEINSGIYLFRPKALFKALEKIKPENQKKEYYLTDIICLMDKAGEKVEAFSFAAAEEIHGINSQADLASAFKILNQRTLKQLQAKGVTLVAPDQTFIAPNVKIGSGTVVYPWTYIEGKVRIGKKCRIGPFAKIRSGSTLDDGVVIGSFVEVVRSKIGKGVFAKHLSYLGDAVIGAETNIGAGTITANYDGRKKNKTEIGKKAFIGVNTVFIAPATVGDRARTGAGAVLTRGAKVKPGETYVGVPARRLKTRK